MTTRCLAAWTALSHPYPPYVNVSQRKDGVVMLTMRHAPGTHPTLGYPTPGPCVAVEMSADAFADLLRDLVKNIRT